MHTVGQRVGGNVESYLVRREGRISATEVRGTRRAGSAPGPPSVPAPPAWRRAAPRSAPYPRRLAAGDPRRPGRFPPPSWPPPRLLLLAPESRAWDLYTMMVLTPLLTPLRAQ